MTIKTINIGGRDIQVDTSIADRLVAANNAKLKATGTPIQINQAYRTNAEQAELYRRSQAGEIGRAAPPGMSFHETGKAVDVTNLDESQSYLNRYGLRNDLADDKGHFSYGETQDVKYETFADSVEKGRQRGYSDTQLLAVFTQKHPEQASAIQASRERYGVDDNIKNDRDLTNFLALRYSGVGNLQTPSVAEKEVVDEDLENFLTSADIVPGVARGIKARVKERGEKVGTIFASMDIPITQKDDLIRKELGITKESNLSLGALSVGAEGILLLGDVAFEVIKGLGKSFNQMTGRKLEPGAKEFMEDVIDIAQTAPAGLLSNIRDEDPERADRIEDRVDAIKDRLATDDLLRRRLAIPLAALDLVGFGKTKGIRNAASEAIEETAEMLAKKGPALVRETVDGVERNIGEAIVGGKKILAKGEEVGEQAAKFSITQATGLNRQTIDDIINNPDLFTKEVMQAIDRETVANKVIDVVQGRLNALKDTGSAYTAIREGTGLVSVKKNFLQDIIEKTFKLNVKDGKITPTTESITRNRADIKKVQDILQDWGDKRILTANEFLNLRNDLTELAKFDALSGKSKESETIAKALRVELNRYRDQVDGLKELDAVYSKEKETLKTIKKDYFKSDGTRKDNAVSSIANLTGKGKEAKLERLQELMPGIEREIKILKAIEDIEVAKGQKVGTYARSVLGAGGAVTGNIPAVITSILASPDIAVQLLRKYAALKGVSKALLDSTITSLRRGKQLVGEQVQLFKDMLNSGVERLKQWTKEAKETVKKIKDDESGFTTLGPPSKLDASQANARLKSVVERFSQDEIATMENFIDHTRGINKLKREDKFILENAAQDIADKLELDEAVGTNNKIANKFDELLADRKAQAKELADVVDGGDLMEQAKKFDNVDDFIDNYYKDGDIVIPDIQGIEKGTIKKAISFDNGEDFYQKFGSGISEIKDKAGIRYPAEVENWWNANIKPLKVKAKSGKEDFLNSTNPTGGIGDAFDYSPQTRANQEIDISKLTTLDKTNGADADTYITIYRGAPKTQKGITPGDFITDLPELAESYAGNNAHILSKRVRLGDIIDDIVDGGGNEYLYRPNADKEIAKTRERLTEIFNEAKK